MSDEVPSDAESPDLIAFPAAAPPEPLPRKRYARKIDEYAAVYETSTRQLRRWIATGLEARDPCPLDEPGAMAKWWADNMTHRVPAKIAALAVVAAAPAAPLDSVPAPPVPFAISPTGMDLGELGKDAGESVLQARALVDGAYQKLRNAYALGDDSLIRLWHPRWEKTVEALRKQEKDDIASRRILGLVIEKAAVEADIVKALVALKQMRTFMVRRVCEALAQSCPDLDPRLLEEIGRAIEAQRAREDEVFRDMASLKSEHDVEFALAS